MIELLYFLIFCAIFIFMFFRRHYKWYRKLTGGKWYKQWQDVDFRFYWSRNQFGASYIEDYTNGKKGNLEKIKKYTKEELIEKINKVKPKVDKFFNKLLK